MEQCPTETMLIAMMFAQPNTMPEATAWLENKPDFFQIPNNQHLYEVLMHLRKEGKVIDYISVSLLLSKHIANPMEYLISLDSAVLGMTDIYTPMLMATESYLLRRLHAVTNKPGEKPCHHVAIS